MKSSMFLKFETNVLSIPTPTVKKLDTFPTTIHPPYTDPVQQPQASVQQKASTSDVVNISNQARQLASDGDTAAQEASETLAVKNSELLKGVP